MSENKESVAPGDESGSRPEVDRYDLASELGRRRWIRALSATLSDEKVAGWREGFEQRHPPVRSWISGWQPIPALPVCARNSSNGEIEFLEQFVPPAPITMEHVQQIRRFTRTESSCDPDETLEQINQARIDTAFKSWNDRLQLAAEELRRRESPQEGRNNIEASPSRGGKRGRSRAVKRIDLEFRPPNYFWPLGIERRLLFRIKGVRRKKAVKALLDSGRHEEIPGFLAKSALSKAERIAIGRLHPMFMGDDYPSDKDERWVEIARITIHSMLSDVTAVFAKCGPDGITYRVVDECGGETLSGDNECTSNSLLSLGELADFYLGAFDLMDVLEGNEFEDLDSMQGFFRTSSAFYAQFDVLLRQRVVETFGPDYWDRGDDEDA